MQKYCTDRCCMDKCCMDKCCMVKWYWATKQICPWTNVVWKNVARTDVTWTNVTGLANSMSKKKFDQKENINPTQFG